MIKDNRTLFFIAWSTVTQKLCDGDTKGQHRSLWSPGKLGQNPKRGAGVLPHAATRVTDLSTYNLVSHGDLGSWIQSSPCLCPFQTLKERSILIVLNVFLYCWVQHNIHVSEKSSLPAPIPQETDNHQARLRKKYHLPSFYTCHENMKYKGHKIEVISQVSPLTSEAACWMLTWHWQMQHKWNYSTHSFMQNCVCEHLYLIQRELQRLIQSWTLSLLRGCAACTGEPAQLPSSMKICIFQYSNMN